MRRLSAGDVDRKLALINQSERSRRWRRKARAHLIADAGRTVEKICTKRRYSTCSKAHRALVDTWRSVNPSRHEKRAYRCNRCGAWHLTSQSYIGGPSDGHREEQGPESER